MNWRGLSTVNAGLSPHPGSHPPRPPVQAPQCGQPAANPQGDYAKLYAGKPDYAKNNNLGIMIYGWTADWPDGFGFLQQIIDSRVIRAAGRNTNLGASSPRRWTT